MLVINGDILTTLDYAEMYAFHRSRSAAATIASYPREVKIDFGVLLFGDDPHVLTGYQEKPEYSFEVSMGVYILDPLAWDLPDAGPAACRCPTCWSRCGTRGHDIHCYRQECYWLDIGRHDDYATANEIFESRRGAFLGNPDDQETQDRARPVNASFRQLARTSALWPSLAAYLVGSIPFGYLIACWVKGIDIRTVGSGNLGATNVGRTLGFRYFLLVLTLDLLKGFLPTIGFPWLLDRLTGSVSRRPAGAGRAGGDPRSYVSGLSRSFAAARELRPAWA